MSEKKKIRLYLDTSVPSAYYDTSKPLRQLITQKWFEYEAVSYELYISVITVEEIGKVMNDVKRQNISGLTVKYGMEVLDLSSEAKSLADEYMNRGAIPKSEPQDAYHIAIATLNELDALASWNFKHIVSINPIRKIHEINRKYNLPAIEIGSPEIFGGRNMEIYKNSYEQNEDMMLWELHEIRHQLHKEFTGKTVDEINRDALKKFQEWRTEYSAGQLVHKRP